MWPFLRRTHVVELAVARDCGVVAAVDMEGGVHLFDIEMNPPKRLGDLKVPYSFGGSRVAVCAQGSAIASSDFDDKVAAHARDGRLLWERRGMNCCHAVHADRDRVCCAMEEHSLVFDLKGDLLEEMPAEINGFRVGAAVGWRFEEAWGNTLVLFEEGREQCVKSCESKVSKAAVDADGAAYVSFVSARPSLTKFRRRDGKVLWRREFGSNARLRTISTSSDESRVVAVVFDMTEPRWRRRPYVWELDAATGRVLTRRPVGYRTPADVKHVASVDAVVQTTGLVTDLDGGRARRLGGGADWRWA